MSRCRQRIGIARALTVEPAVIIADGPISAFDALVQAQIVNVLGELQGRLALASLFITHDMPVMRHVGHRVAVRNLGSVLETMPMEMLSRAPPDHYTAGLIAAVPQVDAGARRRGSPGRAAERNAAAAGLPVSSSLPRGGAAPHFAGAPV